MGGVWCFCQGVMEEIASWAEVRDRAVNTRRNDGVRIMSMTESKAVGQVRSSSTPGRVYQTELTFAPGTRQVALWSCSCPWNTYSWGRSGPWAKYEGRMCNHALAMMYEVQSGEFGGETIEDEPGFTDDVYWHTANLSGEDLFMAQSELHDPDTPALPETTGEAEDALVEGALAHLAKLRSLAAKEARIHFSLAEQSAVINETPTREGGARNFDRMDISGTHYENDLQMWLL